MSSLLIQQYQMGPLDNFVYIISCPQTKEAALIDPAWDTSFLIQELERCQLHLSAILLTHAHHDHINGVSAIQQKFQVPTLISEHEASFLTKKLNNLTQIKDGHLFKLGHTELKAIHTPGHSPGCQCFLHTDHLISGDTLFIDACGRCDLPGSNPEQLFHSLIHIIRSLPDHLIVWPGHHYGPTPHDTLGHQKISNPFLQMDQMNNFIQNKMSF